MNVGEEFPAREKENRRNSASVVTDNHPVGSRCLARMIVTELHFVNAGVQYEEALGDRKRFWAEI